MFNGIIKNKGKVVNTKKLKNRILLSVQVSGKLAYSGKNKNFTGSSVAVNGTCLSIEEKKNKILTFSVIPETLKRTNLGKLNIGDYVNIEFPLKLSDFISGHIVQGHIDCTGKIVDIKQLQNTEYRRKNVKISTSAVPTDVCSVCEMWIKIPEKFSKLLIYKGSIALDGISLTINSVKVNKFKVSLIPLTLQETNLQYKKLGDLVNIEFDYIAKIVEKLTKK